MQKILSFLEQNVQWVALGLGGVYLLFILYSYVLQPPVLVSVGSRQLPPGDVDREILKGPAATLDAYMNRPGVPERMEVKDYARLFTEAMDGRKPGAAAPFTGMWFISSPAGSFGLDIKPLEQGPIATLVAKLPTPAPAKPVGETQGRSTVVIPRFDAAGNPLPPPPPRRLPAPTPRTPTRRIASG